MRIPTIALALATLTAPALAEDAARIEVAESAELGRHLATDDGRPVYLFTTDTRGSEDAEPEISCTNEACLQAWPLVTTEGAPEAGDDVATDMLGTMSYAGRTIVTYNGWPLYHYYADEGIEAPQGQEIRSFGGEWYLLTPDGEKLEEG